MECVEHKVQFMQRRGAQNAIQKPSKESAREIGDKFRVKVHKRRTDDRERRTTMAATTALPKTILITLPMSSMNNQILQTASNGSTNKIGQKRAYSLITQPQHQQHQQVVTLVNHQKSSASPPAIWLPATVQQQQQPQIHVQQQPQQRLYKTETIDDDDYEYEDEDDSDSIGDHQNIAGDSHMRMIQYANEHEQPPRKRERLTHLSAEEKMYRRKLKNRIAAQTARDRKKALMGDLEDTVRRLEEDNESLSVENTKLRREQTSLAEENERLKKLLTERGEEDGVNETKPITNNTNNNISNNNNGSVANATSRVGARMVDAVGPAVSINAPLPKEQAKTTNATTWLLASALIQIFSSCCVKSLPKEQQLKVIRELEQLKENNSLTLEDVINRSPPEAIKKLESIIRAYTKPP